MGLSRGAGVPGEGGTLTLGQSATASPIGGGEGPRMLCADPTPRVSYPSLPKTPHSVLPGSTSGTWPWASKPRPLPHLPEFPSLERTHPSLEGDKWLQTPRLGAHLDEGTSVAWGRLGLKAVAGRAPRVEATERGHCRVL